MRLVCYFSSWAQDREGPARFLPRDVNTGLCSHLIYAFAGMSGHQLSPLEDRDITRYQELNSLKQTCVAGVKGAGGRGPSPPRCCVPLLTS